MKRILYKVGTFTKVHDEAVQLNKSQNYVGNPRSVCTPDIYLTYDNLISTLDQIWPDANNIVITCDSVK